MTGCSGGNGPGPRDALPPRAAAPPETDPPADTAPGTGVLRRVVRIVNPLGLHPRVADRFSRAARQYACSVSVSNGAARADGKDIWGLIMLVAECNTEVVLEVAGPDAPAAAGHLADILASPGGEDHTL